MAEKLLVELQDDKGNIFYLHTSSAAVFCADGKTVQEKIGTVKGRITTKENLKLVTEANYLPEAKAVKDYFDELNGKLKIKYADNGKAITIGANGTVYYTWSVPAVTGYTPIAVVIIGPGYPDQFTVTASLKNNNTVHVYVKNNHGAQLTSSIDTRVIYIPSDMWQAK